MENIGPFTETDLESKSWVILCLPSILKLNRAGVRGLPWQCLKEWQVEWEGGLATDHDAAIFHFLKFLLLYPYLCVAADHDAASRERPMLRADVGHLAHLEANLQQQKILWNTKY